MRCLHVDAERRLLRERARRHVQRAFEQRCEQAAFVRGGVEAEFADHKSARRPDGEPRVVGQREADGAVGRGDESVADPHRRARAQRQALHTALQGHAALQALDAAGGVRGALGKHRCSRCGEAGDARPGIQPRSCLHDGFLIVLLSCSLAVLLSCARVTGAAVKRAGRTATAGTASCR